MRTGRPTHAPTAETRALVKELAGFGIPHEQISRRIGLAEMTLRKHYETELGEGASEANAAVARNLFRIATGDGKGAVPAAIFWLRMRARWSEFDLSAPPKIPAPGKKAAADIAAHTAGENTGWSDLVH